MGGFRTALVSAVLAAACGLPVAANAADLIVDGGFETPAVTTAGYQSGFVDYAPGASFGGPSGTAWTVVGSGSNVALTNTAEYTGSAGSPTYYNAHSGDQWLDLTGDQDNGARVGVSQSIATDIGTTYQLSFWVGSFVDVPTSIALEINGVLYGTYANNSAGTSPGQGISCENFVVPVTATDASTTLSFFFAGGRSAAGLDDVSFTSPSTTSDVPEPASWALMVGGFGLVGAAMRRRRMVVRFA